MTEQRSATPPPAETAIDRFLLSLVRAEPRSYAARAGAAQRNVKALLAALGDPHRDLRVIHVAGSKGKGTTVLMLEALLQSAGLRTATFTSPHLEHWTERFHVDGAEIDAARLASALERLRPHVEAMADADPDNAPSFFEVMTAAAFLLFAQSGVDIALIEAGIGGRYDATNVLTPLLAVITSIELEHVDKLGSSLNEIARHKAGIIKPGVPVVCGRLPPAARMEVHAEAERLGAPLYALGRDFKLETTRDADGLLTLELEIGAQHLQVPTLLRAPHLARNAGLAVAAAVFSGLLDAERLAEVMPRAFATLNPPARVEVIGTRPWVVVDGAHTPESTRELAAAIGAMPASNRVLLLSLSGSKSAVPILRPLLRDAACLVVTRAEPLRSRDPEAVAEALRAAFPTLVVECVPDPREAFARARALTQPDGLLCATGSMYLAGLVRRLQREARAKRDAA